MNFAALCCFLVLNMTRVVSISISSADMQRKSLGESCTFLWTVIGNFTSYSIKILSIGSPTALGPNTNHTFNSVKGVITLFIRNIQKSDAGYYSLSINTVNSAALLFVYAAPQSYPILADGRNPSFEGDQIELYCSANSFSLPVASRPKMYYFWYNFFFGSFRNISSGPAVLQNGDILSGHSIRNDGETLAIASVQYSDRAYACSVQEEGSPYKSAIIYYVILQMYSKPYTFGFSPPSRKFNVAHNPKVYLSFRYEAVPLLISYTNWSFTNASGNTTEYSVDSKYSVDSDPLFAGAFSLSFTLSSANSYGNYSITLTNSNGSRTETFQVLPPGPPDTPSNFSVQYATHSVISLHWRCMWYNGYEQKVYVRLMDVTNNEEVGNQMITLATECYDSAYSTLFQSNIQPETDYEASIWSVNTIGSSDVVKLVVRTPKRVSFSISPANVSIVESEATINFDIIDSTKAVVRLNITCCVEVPIQCSYKTYIIANTDDQVVFDILPTGNEYVFGFTVYDIDRYTYFYTLAIVNDVRVSRKEDPTKDMSNVVTFNPDTEKQNGLPVAVIVLVILLGIAILALIGCLIAFLVYKSRQKSLKNNIQQQSPAATTRPSSANKLYTTTHEYEDDINYEQIKTDRSSYTPSYTPLQVLPQPSAVRNIATEEVAT